jgi:UDP-N-acetylglucosamine--N-acetylmuramyl-(pentapeptide) pyrophosphoryl-undecaprenol N-acetylglucosamine transferase
MALWWLVWNRIDVVFCKGWYVSLPVVLMGWLLRKKIYLHESDTKPGIANRICSKFATKIFTGFSWVFPGKEIVVGQILDDDLLEGVVDWKEKSEKTNILISWWSQWAESVYKVLKSILSSKAYPHTFFHVILGTKNHHLQMLFSGLHHIKTYDFVDQKKMGELLALSDVAITRWGTTSLAEQHIFWLKKIIIPLPRTHDQMSNALYYKNMFNDIVVDQDSPFFIWELQEAIEKHTSYKKSPSNQCASEIISAPKDTILKAILAA